MSKLSAAELQQRVLQSVPADGSSIGNQSLTAVITRDAVRELKLRRGDEAVAIIKSTEVMIGREQS